MTKRSSRLDDAARAGWLYYVAGNTQDQIASKLGVSRQTAQRLVSLARSEGLVRVQIDHPIANCLELSNRLRERFELKFVDVVPTDPGSDSTITGVAESASAELERWLRREEPVLIAVGTGRTLKAAVELLPRMDCRQHKVVSLTGNIAPDGSAAFYNVVFTMSDSVNVRSFPMPLPVIASSAGEREMLHAQAMVRPTLELAKKADVTFVGIGDFSDDAPLFVDGFITKSELTALQNAGAAGEIVGWSFDAAGRMLEGLTNGRVASAPIPPRDRSLVIAAAKGPRKLAGIRGAIRGGLINGLITDEETAEKLLSAAA
ncbi:sugar-binding transcriptional regulator [Rhizobium sp. KVB221]|uniref:Sugar-binding transcriptional regulator n=1 Tax=Rhizobium setariae TaxID=2801340 RepID=A0A937CL06_9HYPH|nr:sugar-binding transcriptional regulator [Rhizobium setariae]MBL0372680.1 sugar-binding transcriptional regulator [Rhizobium setariae]